MQTVQIKVFSFDELSDDAKENARNWYREGSLDYDWWESTFEDAQNIGLKLASFDLDRNRGATGAFTETVETVVRLIIAHHGPKCETYKTAKAFLTDLRKLRKRQFDYDERYASLCAEFERSLIEDYSLMLQHEYEYLLSDEQVDESITANEYTFTQDGKRFNARSAVPVDGD